MIDSCDRLEDWNNGHKARSVSIRIDDGYGASAWGIELYSEGRKIVACEAAFIQLGEPAGKIGETPYWDGDEGAIVVFAKEPDRRWAGLKATLNLALDIAEATGLLPLSKKDISQLKNDPKLAKLSEQHLEKL